MKIVWNSSQAGNAAGAMTGGFGGGAALFGAGLVPALNPAATLMGGLSLYVGILAGFTYVPCK